MAFPPGRPCGAGLPWGDWARIRHRRQPSAPGTAAPFARFSGDPCIPPRTNLPRRWPRNAPALPACARPSPSRPGTRRRGCPTAWPPSPGSRTSTASPCWYWRTTAATTPPPSPAPWPPTCPSGSRCGRPRFPLALSHAGGARRAAMEAVADLLAAEADPRRAALLSTDADGRAEPGWLAANLAALAAGADAVAGAIAADPAEAALLPSGLRRQEAQEVALCRAAGRDGVAGRPRPARPLAAACRAFRRLHRPDARGLSPRRRPARGAGRRGPGAVRGAHPRRHAGAALPGGTCHRLLPAGRAGGGRHGGYAAAAARRSRGGAARCPAGAGAGCAAAAALPPGAAPAAGRAAAAGRPGAAGPRARPGAGGAGGDRPAAALLVGLGELQARALPLRRRRRLLAGEVGAEIDRAVTLLGALRGARALVSPRRLPEWRAAGPAGSDRRATAA